jgi:hypothetical protein
MSHPPIATTDYCDLIIVNGTDCPLTMTNTSTNDMKGLKFPSTIWPFTSAIVKIDYSNIVPPSQIERNEGGGGGSAASTSPTNASSSSTATTNNAASVSTSMNSSYAEIKYILPASDTEDSKEIPISLDFIISFHNVKVISTTSYKRTFVDNLGWPHHPSASLEFVISGFFPHYCLNNRDPAANWMSMLLQSPLLAKRKDTITLREITLLGSHHASMNEVIQPTLPTKNIINKNLATAHEEEVVNPYDKFQFQGVSILNQLMFGSRYLDIHPIQKNGKFYSGFYHKTQRLMTTMPNTNDGVSGEGSSGKSSSFLGEGELQQQQQYEWEGALGQSLHSLITDINNFTSYFKELVIVSLTNDHNLDHEGYPGFTAEEYSSFFHTITSSLHNLYLLPKTSKGAKDENDVNADMDGSDITDFTLLPLNSLIANKACVIVLVDCPAEYLKEWTNHGIYHLSSFKESSLNRSRSLSSDSGAATSFSSSTSFYGNGNEPHSRLVPNNGSIGILPTNVKIPTVTDEHSISIFAKCSKTENVEILKNDQLTIMKNFAHAFDKSSTYDYLSRPLHELLMLDWFLLQGTSTTTETTTTLTKPFSLLSSAIASAANVLEETFTSENKKEVAAMSKDQLKNHEPITSAMMGPQYKRTNYNLAAIANSSLCSSLLANITKDHYPNIVLMDQVDKSSFGWFALAVNLKLASMNR